MQGILNPSLVEEAFAMVRPLIEKTLKDYAKRTQLAVVVTGTEVINPRKPQQSFIDNCFLISFFSNPSNQATWEHDYLSFALAKAEKSVRTGKGSAELAPHYLLQGDTILWGSVVLDGIVVACSGVEPYYDEMFSMWIAAAIKALAKKRFTELPPDQIYV